MWRVDILVYVFPLLPLRVPLFWQFTGDLGDLLLASLVLRSGGVFIFFLSEPVPLPAVRDRSWSGPAPFSVSPMDTGWWLAFCLFCFILFSDFSLAALDLPLCHECCPSFRQQLKAYGFVVETGQKHLGRALFLPWSDYYTSPPGFRHEGSLLRSPVLLLISLEHGGLWGRVAWRVQIPVGCIIPRGSVPSR